MTKHESPHKIGTATKNDITVLEWRFTGCANSEPLYYAYRDIINFTD